MGQKQINKAEEKGMEPQVVGGVRAGHKEELGLRVQ